MGPGHVRLVVLLLKITSHGKRFPHCTNYWCYRLGLLANESAYWNNACFKIKDYSNFARWKTSSDEKSRAAMETGILWFPYIRAAKRSKGLNFSSITICLEALSSDITNLYCKTQASSQINFTPPHGRLSGYIEKCCYGNLPTDNSCKHN